MLVIEALVETTMTLAFYAIVIGVPCYLWLRLRKAGKRVPDFSRWVTCEQHLDTYPDWDQCRHCSRLHEGR